MFLELKIKLLRKLMFFWDVFFTFIDNQQLKVYLGMRNKLDTFLVYYDAKKVLKRGTKKVNKNPLVVDSNSIYGKINGVDVKFKITRGAGDGF